MPKLLCNVLKILGEANAPNALPWLHACSKTCLPEMSGPSYFAIQIQSWYFKTQSKSNRCPKVFLIVKPKSKWSPKNFLNALFSQ